MDKPYKLDDMWFKKIPPKKQISRQEFIAVADGYFTGLQKNDGTGSNGTGTYPFTADCHRIKNGFPTTNFPRRENESPESINLFAMDCTSQFKLGICFVVQSIHSGRYPVVDWERGILWAHAVFDQGTGIKKGPKGPSSNYTDAEEVYYIILDAFIMLYTNCFVFVNENFRSFGKKYIFIVTI